MFRDKSSLANIGYGLTSRDVPESNREESVSNPNSGFIARILNDKPIIKFVSITAATMAGAFASNKLLAKGGIRLAQFAQGKADSGSRLGRRFVEKASQIKKTLDELEGINRFVADGVDPYEKLINRSADGKIIKPTLTKLTGDSYVSDGARWMTSSEYRSLRSGREPVAVWDYKDEIQQRLVRSARSLPLTLPSVYFVQKGVTDRFKGQDQNNKVNWYNPVDVITDFVKQSTLNVTTMILPQNLAGAGLKRIKSLTDSQYLDYDFPLTPMQKKTANSFADIKTILKSFGQDSEKLLSQASRISASAGYAFRTSLQEQQSRTGGGLVFALREARRGYAAAHAASTASAEGKLKKLQKVSSAYLFGYNDASRSYQTIGAVDGIPGIRGIAIGGKTFTRNFSGGKRAYDVVHGAMSFDEAMRATSSNPTEARRVLSTAISEIKSHRKSRISGFSRASLRSASNPNLDGANEPGTRESFGFAFQADTYGKAVQDKLINLGADPVSAKNMVSGLKISGLDTSRSISERVTLGISRIDSVSDSDEDFFRILVDRANKELKNKGRKLDLGQAREAFRYADALFQSDDFKQSLATRSEMLYQSVKKEIIIPSASALVKPQKALFSEFTGDLQPNKVDYLTRSIANKLGINLTDNQTGISRELAKRGIDPNNIQQLRSFLIDEKLMTRPSDVGGFNIFGLRQVTVDKAFDVGIFSGLSPADQVGTRALFGEIAQQDPISRTVGFSTVRGVFESASGNIIDTTGITDSSKKLLQTLTQNLGVPVVRFNPLQMLGIGGPRKIDSNQEIQFVPGISRQDFLAGGGENASVFAWVKEKGGLFGSVGKLFSVSEQADTPAVKQLPGLFKAISSIDTDIYSRATRLATGRQSYRDSELTAIETGENLSRGERVKSLFDVNEEQPNSFSQRVGRFLGRKTDIRNEPTISTLIKRGEINLRGGKKLVLSLGEDGLPSVIDESGSVVYSPDEVAEAFENFRISSQGKGTDLRSMAAIEEGLDIDPALRVSGLIGPELLEAGNKALETFGDIRSSLQAGGTNVTGLSRSARNLERIMQESEATATFISTNKSSTITTRQEYLRNLIHRFNVESATYKSAGGDPVYASNKLEEILRGLEDSGEISSAQLSEARAAAAGTVLNLSAMRSYVRRRPKR